MGDDSWDTSDFLKRYASKSQDANTNHVVNDDDEMNGMMESESISHVNMYDPCNDYAFCTPENLTDRLQYLNQELSILGFPSILDKAQITDADADVHFDVTKLVNCTYDLIKRHHRQLKIKEDIEARQVRSENDNDMLLQTQDRLRHDIEQLKREGALSLFREKEQEKKCTCLQRDIKNEREEKRKMKNDTDYLRKQFYHESKRLEKEISRLKEKVHQSLSDKSSERKMTIDMLNPLMRADGKRSRWKSVSNKSEEEMYKLVIANYEEKEKVILMENHALRGSLSEVHNNLNKIDSSITSEVLAENTKEYQMPYHMVKEDIDNKLKYALVSIKSKMEKADEKVKEVSLEVSSEPIEIAPAVDKQNDEMLNKLEQCKVVIASQEKLIQGMKDGYSEEAFEKLLTTFGTREEELIEYEQRKKLLQEQQQHFDDERQKFTEYVLKMAKEKEEFERERVDLYMQCISTPVINKDMKNTQKGLLKSCTSTPTFTSPQRNRGSSKKQRAPSTGDLYKYLSLSYDSASRNKALGSPTSDGTFLYLEENSPQRRSSSRKVREHSDKIRKAVEDRQNKSGGEEKIRNILSELENLN